MYVCMYNIIKYTDCSNANSKTLLHGAFVAFLDWQYHHYFCRLFQTWLLQLAVL